VSRLLQYLSGALAQGGDQATLLRLRTRLAIHFARKGDLQAAYEAIAELRKSGAAGMFAEATVCANLAEGVALLCSGSHVQAFDKLRRALAIGDASSLKHLSRWTRAWLAHLALDAGQLDAVAPHASEALESAAGAEHWVLSRIGTTIASGLHFGDRYDLARPWYEFARQHAVAEGDDLTIDANLYNVAALRIHNLRLSEVASTIDPGETSRAEMELKSSFNYDTAKSPKSYRWAIPLIELQLNMLLNRYDVLIEQLPKWIEAYREIAPARHVTLVLADHARVLAQAGDASSAIEALESAVRRVPADMADDEMALLRFGQSRVFKAAGDTERAVAFFDEAVGHLDTHRQGQRRLVDALGAIAHRRSQ
jgi:tetratricopeptide (TPR) repeat protein